MDRRQDMPYRFDTLAVRAGQHRSAEGEQGEPIFTTSSYVFGSAAQAAARFSGDEPGNIYSRFTNPTVNLFQERLAALEGAESCVATASGMSAILSVCMGLLRSGDRIVSSRGVFGSTMMLFDNFLTRFGVDVRYVESTVTEDWNRAISNGASLVFLETPSNPLTELYDIRAIAESCRENGAILVVDNCFCTPALQRPLELGADIVVHSATKYLDGQGRCVGGAVVGDSERVGKDVFGFLRTAGPSMSPFNAWIFAKGLETLSLRMRVHCENALELARWLEAQSGVRRVWYPGLESHPQYELARIQQSGFGGIIAFEVEGGRETAWRVIDATELMSITANLGDAKTTITHPATTTHGRLTPEQREKAGIAEGLIRIAAGLEDADDLIRDLRKGLKT
ncbi:MAG: O-succinylhomoserine sulfhydrylase [Gammaproteobacteria bacterium]|nr:O-succinylhomoserine sulfhydrylase [Gammaproteobacteria bacterium]